MNSNSDLDVADQKILSSVKFDALGPIIINTDGTLSRIPNWDSLTDAEKVKTMRIIAKRNKSRREALNEQLANTTEGSEAESNDTNGEILALTDN